MSLENLTMDFLDPTSPVRAPPLRKRSLTLESHCHPFTGSSLGKDLEQKRLNLTQGMGTGRNRYHGSRRQINHSCRAGNLHCSKVRRRCFIEVSSFDLSSVYEALGTAPGECTVLRRNGHYTQKCALLQH